MNAYVVALVLATVCVVVVAANVLKLVLVSWPVVVVHEVIVV